MSKANPWAYEGVRLTLEIERHYADRIAIVTLDGAEAWIAEGDLFRVAHEIGVRSDRGWPINLRTEPSHIVVRLRGSAELLLEVWESVQTARGMRVGDGVRAAFGIRERRHAY